jgi:hypothetical protein
MREAIQRPGIPVQKGWIASSQQLLAMTAEYATARAALAQSEKPLIFR